MLTKTEYRVVWMQRIRGAKEPAPLEKGCATLSAAVILANELTVLESCSDVTVQSRQVTPWIVLEQAA